MDWDLIVIGGGAAGLAAAREALRLRARVLLVQDGPPGGDCTFTGCVPSKAVLAAAERGRSFDEAMSSARRIVGAIAATEDEVALRAEGIEVVRGRAAFVTPTEIDCDGRRLRAARFVVATGSHPAAPGVDGLGAVGYLTNETVFGLEQQPSRLAVLGGGPEGCELAQAFARLGSQVTLLDSAPRILPGEEPETSAVITAALSAEGVVVMAGASAARVGPAGSRPGGAAGLSGPGGTLGPAGGAVVLTVDGGDDVVADALLVATGRRPDLTGLGIEALGVRTEAGAITVDERMATNVAGIWAAGDVTPGPRLTHVADEMGRLAAHNALTHNALTHRSRPGGRGRRLDRTALPQVVFTDPEVGRVGITEAEAGPDARVAWLPMTAVDRAVLSGRVEGFVKLIAGPQPLVGHRGGGRLLGATIVCPHAGEVIHEAALAVRTRMFAGRLAQTVHAYPSWSIALRQAAAQLVTDDGAYRARPARAS